MSPIDVNPTKEIKGVTLRGAIQAAVILFTVVIAYGKTTNQVEMLSKSNQEARELIKEMQQYNSVQIDLIKNQLREQDIRLIKLEARSDLKNLKY